MLIIKNYVECNIKKSSCPQCHSTNVLLAETDSAQTLTNAEGHKFVPQIYFPVLCKTCGFDITKCMACGSSDMDFKQEILAVSVNSITVPVDQLVMNKNFDFEPTDPQLATQRKENKTQTFIGCLHCGKSAEEYILQCINLGKLKSGL